MSKLFIPGPVNVSTYFRDSSFAEVVKENEKLLLAAICCKKGRAIPYILSGTGVMDAVVTNLISDKDKVLVIDGGGFGKRWYDICTFYNKNVTSLKPGFGKNIDMNHLRSIIKSNQISIIIMQHHETTSGQLYDVKKVGKISKEFKTFLIVDAISSFLTDEYHMDDFNIDGTIISSQKGLRMDPGLSFLILNNNLLEHSKMIPKLNFYNNIDTYLDSYNLGRGHTPFTPAVGLILKLNEKLKNLNIEYEIKKIQQIASHFRKQISCLPLKIVPQTPSNFLTCLTITDEYYKKSLYDYLKAKDMFIYQSDNRFSNYFAKFNKLIRVAHIGCNIEEHNQLVKEMSWFFGKRD
jgi:aspartate aminotransferase-like enzyme